MKQDGLFLNNFLDGITRPLSEKEISRYYNKKKKELDTLASAYKKKYGKLDDKTEELLEEQKMQLRRALMSGEAMGIFDYIDQQIKVGNGIEQLKEMISRCSKQEKGWLEKRLNQQRKLRKIEVKVAKEAEIDTKKQEMHEASSKKAEQMLQHVQGDIKGAYDRYVTAFKKNRANVLSAQQKIVGLDKKNPERKVVVKEMELLSKNVPKLSFYLKELQEQYKHKVKDLEEHDRKLILKTLKDLCEAEEEKLKAEFRSAKSTKKEEFKKAKEVAAANLKAARSADRMGKAPSNTAQDLYKILTILPGLALNLKTSRYDKVLDIHDPTAIVFRILSSSPATAASVATTSLFRFDAFMDFAKNPKESKIGKLLASDEKLTGLLAADPRWRAILENYNSEIKGIMVKAIHQDAQELAEQEPTAELSDDDKRAIAKIASVHAENLLRFISMIEAPVTEVLKDTEISQALAGKIGVSGEKLANIVGVVSGAAPKAYGIPKEFIEKLIGAILLYPTPTPLDLNNVCELLPRFKDQVSDILPRLIEDENLQKSLVFMLELVRMPQSEQGKRKLLAGMESEEYLPSLVREGVSILKSSAVRGFVASQVTLYDAKSEKSIFNNPVIDPRLAGILAHLAKVLFDNVDKIEQVTNELVPLLGSEGKEEALKHASAIASSDFVQNMVEGVREFLSAPNSQGFREWLNEQVEKQPKLCQLWITGDTFLKIVEHPNLLKNTKHLLEHYESGSYFKMAWDSLKIVGTALTDLNIMGVVAEVFGALMIKNLIPAFIKRALVQDCINGKMHNITAIAGEDRLDLAAELRKDASKLTMLQRYFVKSTDLSGLHLEKGLENFNVNGFEFKNARFIPENVSFAGSRFYGCDFTGVNFVGKKLDLSNVRIDFATFETMEKSLQGKDLEIVGKDTVTIEIIGDQNYEANIEKVKRVFGEEVKTMSKKPTKDVKGNLVADRGNAQILVDRGG